MPTIAPACHSQVPSQPPKTAKASMAAPATAALCPVDAALEYDMLAFIENPLLANVDMRITVSGSDADAATRAGADRDATWPQHFTVFGFAGVCSAD